MANKFNYYDIVRIKSNHAEKKQFNGREGFVLGISEPGKSGEYAYAVYLEGEKYGWDFMESELEMTGKKHEADFYGAPEGATPSTTSSPRSPYDEPIDFTQKQIIHTIFGGLLDADVPLDATQFEKLFRSLAASFEIDPNYVKMFVRQKIRLKRKKKSPSP